MSRKTTNKPNIISIIIWIIATIIFSFLTYQIFKANVLPIKIFIILPIIIIFMLILFFTFINNRRTKKWLLLFLNIIFIFISVVSSYGIYKIIDVMSFLDSNLGVEYKTSIYYILVNKDSNYSDIKSIENKTVNLIDDINNKELLEEEIIDVVKVNFEYVDNIFNSLMNLPDDTQSIIIANSGSYDAVLENYSIIHKDEIYSDSVKILETIEIKEKVVNEETGIDVTRDPFVIYLSGIDTRSGKLPDKSLSDVNILIAVNPKRHEILLLNTPRDFYVQLHGIDSMKDKLTHAGLIGGYRLSIETIEDLYSIDIPYFIRVNFNSVIRLVDAIGGISVNSDVNYSFRCTANPNCVIKPGNNYLNGDCALAFARERYAYTTGDRHRGENQQQVISKVIDKVTSTDTLLNNSTNILEALAGTFETNITPNEITELVKMQLKDMKGWNISTYSVNGGDLYTTTYLYPNTELYVMTPDEKTVEEAKLKLNNILSNN